MVQSHMPGDYQPVLIVRALRDGTNSISAGRADFERLTSSGRKPNERAITRQSRLTLLSQPARRIKQPRERDSSPSPSRSSPDPKWSKQMLPADPR